MRRTFIATLLVLILASTSIFSVDDNFAVTTDVSLIGYMKVSASKIGGHTLAKYNDSGSLETLAITTSGDQTFDAFMTTLCNNRTGYTVTMSASPMTSTEGSSTSHINYTVTCNNKSVTTTSTSEPLPLLIMNVQSLNKLTGRSKRISLSVDAATFDAAVAGDYVGTVTFTFAAN